MSVPIIDSYEKFVSFNEKLKSLSHVNSINIESIDYDTNVIKVSPYKYNTTHVISSPLTPLLDLDEFVLDFVNKRDSYIVLNIAFLESYDFARLTYITHPEEYKESLYDYVSQLTLIGENKFTLCNFEVEIVPSDSSYGLSILKYNGSSLRKHLVIPYGITSIADEAFFERSLLEEVEFPSTLKYIGSNAFTSTGLKEVIIPDSVESIGTAAFEECIDLKHVVFPNNLVSLGRRAFIYSGIEEAILPNKLERIDYSTFNNCKNLRKVALPKEIKLISINAFSGTDIREIEIPSTTCEIDTTAFAHCYKLRKVKLSDGLQAIGNGAFMRTAIKEIHIPETVKIIGNSAFYYCQNLKKVNIPSDLEEMGDNAFFGTPYERRNLRIAYRKTNDIFNLIKKLNLWLKEKLVKCKELVKDA